MELLVVMLALVATAAAAAAAAAPTGGLTLTRFNNTACAGRGVPRVLAQPESFEACEGNAAACGAPNSLRLTGRLAPARAGQFGFNVTMEPPLPYPSDEAYCRLWVHDHLLWPRTTAGRTRGRAGNAAPLWIPLPPRALNATTGAAVEHAGAAPLGAYELRFEYVCLRKQGCPSRTISIRMAEFEGATTQLAPWSPLAPPAVALLPAQGDGEAARRALYSELQQGWGTFYHRSMTTWALLPESLTFGVGLYRQSTGQYLPAEGLTVAKPQLFAGAEFAVKVGPHAYNQSYAELSLSWFAGGGLNVTIAATVDAADSSQLTLLATINDQPPPRAGATTTAAAAAVINASDYLLVVTANFTHGRSGELSAAPDGRSVSGVGAGLRARTLHLLSQQPSPTRATAAKPTNASAFPSNAVYMTASLAGGQVALATDPRESVASVVAKTAGYRAAERATLSPYGSEWSEVKGAIQTALMWSFMYDPKEGLVAPMFQVGVHYLDTSIAIICTRYI